ncbi:DUF418 domain-containing protein [Undibacterium sp. LX40W]|uniref:DUF418 domain-containing protein n=1 Tax=Undibacterium nitidum TaxID=2762298 RepID=A0A923HMP7_9BURK|nr:MULTISPECIES: DUF418 domain-containing protein [Undibacterium]MBC3880493.1 DUF418 domain-containing protein [Undibacterium nitidum]MBC3890771.1 DUF418 domain-containing protein [Undibacterium sp. LX40W]
MTESIVHSDLLSQAPSATQVPLEFKPVEKSERIEALDVIRGFALIGIFLMNIEFFNRVVSDIGQGMPSGLSGANWLASYFIAYFVAGKFWTIFSLLFGMGFAVMLTRSEAKGQTFIRSYLRRIIALGIFGACHHIFIWPGDILFTYSVAASGLLIVLFMPGKWWLAFLSSTILLAIVWQNSVTAGLATMFATTGVFIFYLRSEAGIQIRGFKLHGLAVLLIVIAFLMLVIGGAGFLVPSQAKLKGFFYSGLFIAFLGFLVAKYHQPADKRPLRLGAAAYLLLFVSMALGTASQTFDWGGEQAKRAAIVAAMPEFDASKVTDAELKALRAKKDKTEKENVMLAKAEAAAMQAKKAKKDEEEQRVLSKGTYAESVALRAKHFANHAPNELSQCALFIAVFLIGYWFVRSGVIERSAEHLPLFRRLAFIALPFGIGLGVAGSFLALRPIVDNESDVFYFATSLLYIGNLPACLGYVGLMVVLLHSQGPFAKVKVLAPYGRMALTNYLSQSVICSAIFYAYGLGLYGMPRAQQVLVVAVVVTLQVLFSHWWLSKFLYGPMEWLWRAITYWKLPRFKIEET